MLVMIGISLLNRYNQSDGVATWVYVDENARAGVRSLLMHCKMYEVLKWRYSEIEKPY